MGLTPTDTTTSQPNTQDTMLMQLAFQVGRDSNKEGNK